MARKDNRISMPSSGAGLTKYFDNYESKVMFSPEATIITILVVAILVLLFSGSLGL
jgi:preprotein translocase subunit Sec61beta